MILARRSPTSQRAALQTVLGQHVRPIADQAYAVLQASTPRPTDQDLGSGATANQLASAAVAATAAEQEAATAIGSIGARIRDFAARAMPV